MTQEEKSLLLKDLAARVPYDIMVEQTLFPPSLADKEQRLKSVQANNVVQLYWYKYINEFVPIHCIKPYLRPLSSMTNEEFDKLKEYSELKYDQLDLASFQNGAYKCLDFYLSEVPSYVVILVFDWLNEHHFDYRGLIERGLALEAPEGMY